MLINLVDVGAFNRKDDMVFLGKCDNIVRELCRELGWEEELEKMWREIGGGNKGLGAKRKESKGTERAKKEDPLDKISKEMERALTISESGISMKADHRRPLEVQDNEQRVGLSDPAEEKNSVNKRQEDLLPDGKL